MRLSLVLSAVLLFPLASSAAADAPLAVKLEPSASALDVPLFPATRQECTRWDRSVRNWHAVGVVSGALAGASGLVGGALVKDNTAQVVLLLSGAALGGAGALSAYLSGEYATLYRERCTLPE